MPSNYNDNPPGPLTVRQIPSESQTMSANEFHPIVLLNQSRMTHPHYPHQGHSSYHSMVSLSLNGKHSEGDGETETQTPNGNIVSSPQSNLPSKSPETEIRRPSSLYKWSFLCMFPFLMTVICLSISATNPKWVEFQTNYSFPQGKQVQQMDIYTAPFRVENCDGSANSSCTQSSVSNSDISDMSDECHTYGSVYSFDRCEEVSRWKASRGSLISACVFCFITMVFIPIQIYILQKDNVSRCVNLLFTLISFTLSVVSFVLSLLPSILWISIFVSRDQWIHNLPPSLSPYIFTLNIVSGLGLAAAGGAFSVVGCVVFFCVIGCKCGVRRQKMEEIEGNGKGITEGLIYHKI